MPALLVTVKSLDLVWVAAAALLFGLLGGWVADHKQRPYWQGFLLGFALGGFGVVIALFLRRRGQSPPSSPPPSVTEKEAEKKVELPLQDRCASCGSALDLADRFCPSCGARVP